MEGRTDSRLGMAARFAGWLLVAVSVAFIVYKFSQAPQGALERLYTPRAAAVIASFSLAYSLLNLLLALSWSALARGASSRAPRPAPLVRIHMRSGFVKYLPGNIFHLAGRHVMAGGAGVEQGAVLAANVLEMGIIVMAAAAIITVTAALGELETALAFHRGRIDAAGMVFALLALAAGAAVVGALVIKKAPRLLSRPNLRTAASVLLCYLVFFAASALLLYGLAQLASGPAVTSAGYPAVLGVFCLSWIAGFVVPGAPGGLGIRESVIVAALGPVLGTGEALAAALALRMVTVLGDALAFAYSFIGAPAGGLTSPRTGGGCPGPS